MLIYVVLGDKRRTERKDGLQFIQILQRKSDVTITLIFINDNVSVYAFKFLFV